MSGPAPARAPVDPTAGATTIGPAAVAWAWEDRVVTDGLPSLLDEVDAERAASLGPPARHRLRVGRLLLHHLVAERFPAATGWAVTPGRCGRCGDAHLGPRLSGVPALASVAYADGLVVAALAPSTHVGRLGVDAERDTVEQDRLDELHRLLGQSSEKVVRRWTRVEAVLKADGRGLLIDPGAVWLRRGGAWIAGQKSSYLLADVAGPPGFVISLAWSAGEPPVGGRPASRTAGPAGARWSER